MSDKDNINATQNSNISETEIIERCNIAKYILTSSYSQLTRYDGKTSQILTLIGFNFTAVSIFSSWFLRFELSLLMKIIFIPSVIIDLILIIISLLFIKNVLSPRIEPLGNQVKKKRGLLFFMDIKNSFTEEDYVNILVGNNNIPLSDKYTSEEKMKFNKCIIEDCARDIYAQAKILELKAKYVKRSYSIILAITILTFSIIIIMAILHYIGV
jgi:hypothetical protein